jgi:type VI secretion system secreted protein VgrG
MASADTSIFTLVIGSHKPDVFRVLEFNGHEALSENFCFQVKAVAFDLNLKYEDTIGSSATLAVKGADYAVNHFGIVTQFNQVPNSDGTVALDFYYEFTIEPTIKYMTYMVRSRIFQNKTAKEIVEEVIGDYIEKDSGFKFEAKAESGDFPKREFTVQYNETDWDFVRRLLEDEGIWYWWNHEGDRDLLMMSNKPEHVKPLPNTPELVFRPEGGLNPGDGREYVDTLERTVRFVTGRATIKDYNYRTPDVNIIGKYETEGPGEFYHYGDHVKTTDEATRKAQIRAEMFACARETFKGTGVFRSARPGYRFKLTEAQAEGFDGEYLVTRVTHMGGLKEGPEETVHTVEGPGVHYRCYFEAIPAKTQYRPPLATPKPRVNGILTALTDGQKDKYAYIDEEGRYKMKLFFDLSAEKDGKASKAIRLAQPYAGPEYGMHFPLHAGTEIAIGFVDGDPDRPIGLGAVPNPTKGSPVKAGNKSQNMIKSHSGHSITLEDKEGKTGIHISTSGGHNLGLDDSADTKGYAVNTSGSNSLSLDDKNKAISLTTAGGHVLKLDDQGKAVSVTTTGGNTLSMEDPGHKVVLKDGAGNISITLDGDGGKLNIDASQEIVLKTGSSSLTMKMDGTIELKGKNLTIKGDVSCAVEGTATASVQGTALALTGKGSANLSGPVVSIKADAALSLKGAMVTSEADAVNIVKGGAAVMLNP